MKKNIPLTIIALMALVIIAGCKKDNASAWVGKYTAVNAIDSINQVTITEVNSSTLQIAIQANYSIGNVSSVVTFVTIQQAKLQSATSATFNESDVVQDVPAFNGTDQVAGSAALSGNTLTVVGTATNGNLTYNYSFNGSK
jgi:hypothetical protein